MPINPLGRITLRRGRPAWLLASSLLSGAAFAQTQEVPASPTLSATTAATAPVNAPVPASGPERAGTLKQVQGEVRLGTAEGRSGDPVRVGERIHTGARSGGSFVLKDGTVVTLGPQTEVNLGQFQYDATTQNGSFVLNLIRGTARIVSGAIGKVTPERFRVQTPTAVVGIRGTDFIVETHADAAPRMASASAPTADLKAVIK